LYRLPFCVFSVLIFNGLVSSALIFYVHTFPEIRLERVKILLSFATKMENVAKADGDIWFSGNTSLKLPSKVSTLCLYVATKMEAAAKIYGDFCSLRNISIKLLCQTWK
jgi:hypothetical protein